LQGRVGLEEGEPDEETRHNAKKPLCPDVSRQPPILLEHSFADNRELSGEWHSELAMRRLIIITIRWHVSSLRVNLFELFLDVL